MFENSEGRDAKEYTAIWESFDIVGINLLQCVQIVVTTNRETMISTAIKLDEEFKTGAAAYRPGQEFLSVVFARSLELKLKLYNLAGHDSDSVHSSYEHKHKEKKKLTMMEMILLVDPCLCSLSGFGHGYDETANNNIPVTEEPCDHHEDDCASEEEECETPEHCPSSFALSRLFPLPSFLLN